MSWLLVVFNHYALSINMPHDWSTTGKWIISGVARGGAGGDICPRAQGFRGAKIAQIIIALRERARGARAHLESY